MTSETSAARTIEDLPELFNAASDLIEHDPAVGRGGKPGIIDRRGPRIPAFMKECGA